MKVKIISGVFLTLLILVSAVYAADQKASGNIKKADVEFADQQPQPMAQSMANPSVQAGWDYDPFQEMRMMQQRMMQMMDPWGQDAMTGRMSRGIGPMGFASQIRTDFEETPEEYIVTLDLPGYDKKDIEVSLKNNALVVQAEMKGEESEKQDENGRRIISQERSRGVVQRVIRFPQPVKEDGINAKFENGVLTIHVQKSEPDKNVKVPIV